MNKKLCKYGLCFIGAHMIIGNVINPMQNTYISFAQENVNGRSISPSKKQINIVTGKVISYYGLGDTYDESFATYLVGKGITKNEYKKYVEGTKKYENSKLEDIYEVENLIYIFDQAMYTHPVVKSIYDKNMSVYNNKNTAWKYVKKGSIYDTKWLTTVFEESLESVDMEKVYKYLFKKVPTESIKKDLNKKDTIKYGLYSGLLKRELTDEDREKIKLKEGYVLFGISKPEYNEYQNYINLKEKILEKEVLYIKEYHIHKNVRSKIKKQYGIDIYTALTDADRLRVYSISLENYNYSDEKAKKSFETLLKYKGYIKGPGEDKNGISEEAATNPTEIEKNPVKVEGNTIEEYEYLDKGQPQYGIFGSEDKGSDKTNKKLYTAQYYYKQAFVSSTIGINKNEKRYVVKIGDKNVVTTIGEGEPLTDELLIDMLKIAFEESRQGKIVSSEKANLIFVNNKIEVIEKEDEYDIKAINSKLSNIGVTILLMNETEVSKLKDMEESMEKTEENKQDEGQV